MDLSSPREWIGKTETRADLVTAAPMAALSATLDRSDPRPQPGDPVPPLWHWLWFLPVCRQSELGPDGHAERGGFLPPPPLPHRMWAGGRLVFHHPLRVGETITRTSRILEMRSTEGRTGPLVFLTVHHEIRTAAGIALAEEHDIVYRGGLKPGGAAPTPQHAPPDHAWERMICPDDVLLFRYSALTFNGHRIHYDRRYAAAEGYPGIVVHGPLIATLLLDLLRRNLPGAGIARFRFRAVSPLFDGAPFLVRGKPDEGGQSVQLWAQDAAGGLAMTATAVLH